VNAREAGQAAGAGAHVAKDAGNAPADTLVAPPPHALVVEDDEAVRRLLVEVLQQEGCRVTAVADGASAARALGDSPIHLVLTDLKLPDTTGLDVLEQVRRHDPRIVTIVLSGYGSIDLAVQAMKEGAADFLAKPFTPETLSSTLRRILEAHRTTQERTVLKQETLKSGGIRLAAFQLEEMDQTPSHGGTVKGMSAHAWSSDYRRGLADGEKRAREKQAVSMERQHALLAQVVKQIEQASVNLLGKVEEQVAGLAFEIARKVIHQVAEERRELVLTQVQQAVAKIRESAKAGGLVRVRVHPTDLPFLEAARDTIATHFEGPVSLTVEAEASISPGGCRIETETRLVDATLESQLVRLGEALRRKDPRAPQ
jgi:flagellar biosynthesis/type III secretory pathway protein FliH